MPLGAFRFDNFLASAEMCLAEYVPKVFIPPECHYGRFGECGGCFPVGLEYGPVGVDYLLYRWVMVIECRNEGSPDVPLLLLLD